MRIEREPGPPQPTFETMTKQAREVLLQNGCHPPLIVAVGSQKTVELEFGRLAEISDECKDQIYEAGFHTGTFEEIGELETVFFVSEAWARRFSVVAHEPPTDKKSKVEVLMVLGLNTEVDELRWSLSQMVRNNEGVLSRIRPYLSDTQSAIQIPDHLLRDFASGYLEGSKDSSSSY